MKEIFSRTDNIAIIVLSAIVIFLATSLIKLWKHNNKEQEKKTNIIVELSRELITSTENGKTAILHFKEMSEKSMTDLISEIRNLVRKIEELARNKN